MPGELSRLALDAGRQNALFFAGDDGQRHAMPWHEHSFAVGRSRSQGLRGPHLDDLQTGAGTRRECSQVEDTEREIPFLKGYTVFNAEQVDGLPAHYYAQPENPLPLSERIENAGRFMTVTGAAIHKESHYATALHEITHWTMHKDRLERDFSAKRFGDSGYAREEMVAELGAAFLCADLGITPEIRDGHAAYLGNWLTVLKEDKRANFSAAAHAQRAAVYLNGLQPQQQQEEESAAT